MGRNVLSGDLYLFVARRRKRAKVLYFDGTGLCRNGNLVLVSLLVALAHTDIT